MSYVRGSTVRNSSDDGERDICRRAEWRENQDASVDPPLRSLRMVRLVRPLPNCRQEGADSLSLRRVRDLLNEHAFPDILEQSRHSGRSAE